jgi:hypothetical protein
MELICSSIHSHHPTSIGGVGVVVEQLKIRFAPPCFSLPQNGLFFLPTR